MSTGNGAENFRLSLDTLASDLALVAGRKTVYWLSQGFPASEMYGPAWKQTRDWAPTPEWKKTITALNEADVAVNAVGLTRDPYDPIDGPALIMRQIAEATGGQSWFRGSDDIASELAQGLEDSRTAYVLGFYLSEGDLDNRFHDLKVQVNRPGFNLSYRKGYYAGDIDLLPPPRAKGELLETVLLNQMDARDVGFSAEVDRVPAQIPGDPSGTLNLHMKLDTRTMSLTEQDSGETNSRETGSVDELFIELNDRGRWLAKISDTKNFEFATANRERYDSEGVTWPIGITLAPGTVKLVIILRDTKAARVGSLTVPLSGASPDVSVTGPATTPIAIGPDPPREPALVSLGASSEAQQDDPVIEAARKSAIAFARSLPDYIVKRTTTRFGGTRNPRYLAGAKTKDGDVDWHTQDTVTAEVVAEHGTEVYAKVRVNGKPSDSPEASGSWSAGEFSSTLLGILSVKSVASFTNKQLVTLAHRASYRYDFAIDQSHSSWRIDARSGNDVTGYAPPYDGTLWIDKESGQVLRLEMTARDLPGYFPVDNVRSFTAYDFVKIGNDSYLLPTQSETMSCEHNSRACVKNTSVFNDYKKFGTRTSIKFDGGAK
jgi:hypothetical protein